MTTTTTPDVPAANPNRQEDQRDRVRGGAPRYSAQAFWHPDLMCYVHGAEYLAHRKAGRLYLAWHSCCDMSGAIEAFEAVAPDVELIETFAGDVPDTVYQRIDGQWHAYAPREAPAPHVAEAMYNAAKQRHEAATERRVLDLISIGKNASKRPLPADYRVRLAFTHEPDRLELCDWEPAQPYRERPAASPNRTDIGDEQ